MKKSKFITGLSAAFISAMALMSCSSLIKARSGVILTIDGVEYTAEDLFNDQKTPAAAEAKFNAVYKAAVRAYFKKDTQYDKEIENETKIKISEQKATAQSNADKNGTSYATEWQKILDANNVDDEQGLYNKFEYETQKEKYENKWYEDNYDKLREGNPFTDISENKFVNYLEGKQPYHIKHILVKLANAKAGDSVNTEISAKEARKIGNIIINLAKGETKGGSTFEDLAGSEFNDDETARTTNGSLGIMSRDTSFVNDFKLGIYMYESFYGSSTDVGSTHLYKEKAAKVALGLDTATAGTAGGYADLISKIADPSSQIANGLTYNGLGQIPYEAAEKLIEYADYDFSGDTETSRNTIQRFKDVGISSDKVAAKFLPRNVIFNKYFNKHNIMVITPRKLHDYKSTTGQAGTIADWTATGQDAGKKRNTKTDYYRGILDPTLVSENYPGFNQETKAKNEDKLNFTYYNDAGEAISSANDSVLRDEHGRVILVFRSGTGDSSSNDAYQGIHFVVIERSPFIGEEIDKTVSNVDYKTTLPQYYTHFYPTQPNGSHPTYPDGTWSKTFVNYFPNLVDVKDLKARANTVKEELKKADSKLNTYIYQELEKGITWSDKAKELGIKDSIDKWIKISRTTEQLDKKKAWDETWEDYYFSLESQIEQRVEESDGTTVHSKLVPEACAISFIDNSFNASYTLDKLFGEGGMFHE